MVAMRNEQREVGAERSASENSVHTNGEKGTPLYRLRESKAHQPQHDFHAHEAAAAQPPPARTAAYVYQPLQRGRRCKRGREHLGGAQFERYYHIHGAHALFGGISAQRSRKGSLLTKVSPNLFFEKAKIKQKSPLMRAEQAEKRGEKQNSIRNVSPFLSPIWGRGKQVI